MSKPLTLRIKGDGTYHGTVVEVVDANGDAIGPLSCVTKLVYDLGEHDTYATAKLTVLDVATMIETECYMSDNCEEAANEA